ncbi:MAG: YdeI/OmpD-associated family protein [Bacteroidota bacterium]|nr:YdeI/OmpD-associated family protein [Bacteroidota bacterium]
MEKTLFNKKLIIQKYPGKGGWCYVVVTGIPPNKKRKFGFVRVSGTIDNYKLEKYNLMPMKAGTLFLPIRAEIRKVIKKKEGDTIHVTLYEDNTPLEIPEELILCLKEEPKAIKAFYTISDAEQKQYLDWIYSAKKEETKIERIASTINKLLKGEKLYLQKP